MKTVTTVKVLSSCKSVLQFQFLGPRRQNLQSKKLKIDSYFEKRIIFKNDRKVRLVVKSMPILNKYLHSNGNQIAMTENVYKC